VPPTKPRFFRTPGDFRDWLERHAHRDTELWVGFYKRGSAKPSITWPESVDEALCFGWIDGLRKNLDQSSYVIRFTPRRSTSTWSAVNIERMGELQKEGLVRPAGLAAFAARRENRSAIYSHEQRAVELPGPYAAKLAARAGAAAFFAAQPASYRKAAAWWVVSAKQEATRLRRLARLIEDSDKQLRIPQFASPKTPAA
jgi:uncharacterized protein YdeI (YjbR/CyaY-like superfamily)